MYVVFAWLDVSFLGLLEVDHFFFKFFENLSLRFYRSLQFLHALFVLRALKVQIFVILRYISSLFRVTRKANLCFGQINS